MRLQEKVPMDIVAWKHTINETDITYRVQIRGIAWRDRGAVAAAMAGWREAARGWQEGGDAIIIFTREFLSEAEWLAWVGGFPAQIRENKTWGERVKEVIHNKKLPTTLSPKK
jgi:hypothetical protein